MEKEKRERKEGKRILFNNSKQEKSDDGWTTIKRRKNKYNNKQEKNKPRDKPRNKPREKTHGKPRKKAVEKTRGKPREKSKWKPGENLEEKKQSRRNRNRSKPVPQPEPIYAKALLKNANIDIGKSYENSNKEYYTLIRPPIYPSRNRPAVQQISTWGPYDNFDRWEKTYWDSLSELRQIFVDELKELNTLTKDDSQSIEFIEDFNRFIYYNSSRYISKYIEPLSPFQENEYYYYKVETYNHG